MPTLTFDGTLAGWRGAARAALAAGLAPASVVWQPADDPQHGLGLDGGTADAAALPNDPSRRVAPTTTVPRRFLALASLVSCYRDPTRWATLYRVLWRLTRGGEPHLLAVAVDPDILQLTRMAKTIRREVHKLHAFVRFRLVRAADGVDEYIAWFEPEHDVLEQASELFVRRFANMRWAVLTPRCSVRWDGVALAIGPGVPRSDAPAADALEQLWATYYAHIFNPARVKLQAMRSEMPKRYWRNLPEAALIAPMVRDAPGRLRRMVEAAERPPVPPRRRATAPHAIAAPRAVTDVAAARPTLVSSDALAPTLVESTRERVFAPALAALWVERSPAGTRFDVHAHTAMLGGPVSPHRLPRAIRDLLPGALAGAERVEGPLVPDAVREAIWGSFLASIRVLEAGGKLGTVRFRVGREAAALNGWIARLEGRRVIVEP